jgi:hypothetical protein
MSRVIAALKAAGIAERDIQTSNLSISPIYSDPNREAPQAKVLSKPFHLKDLVMEVQRVFGGEAAAGNL